jgi:hypothetical protein
MLQPSVLNCFRLHDRDTAVHACNADTYPATRTLTPASWKSGSDSERNTRPIHSRYREPLYSTLCMICGIVRLRVTGREWSEGRGPCWRGSTECQMFCVYNSLKVNSILRIVYTVLVEAEVP